MIRRAVLTIAVSLLAACTSPPREETERDWEKEAPYRQEVQAFAEESERATTQILYFADTTPPSSPGQIAINYGRPVWKPEYEEKFDALTQGKRWRFGNNSWTSLDANVAFSLAGTEVGSGQYYLVLERSSGDQWYLVLLDPEPIRAKRIDAFFVDDAPQGIKILLDLKLTEEETEKLSVRLIPEESDVAKVLLEIQWGNYRLTGHIEVLL